MAAQGKRDGGLTWTALPRASLASLAVFIGLIAGPTEVLAAPESASTMAEAAAPAPGNHDRIIADIQKRFNARVVKVTEIQVDGRAALDLRLYTDQRVWDVIVDAQTGKVLSGG